MANGSRSSRLLPLFAVLALGLVIGWLLRASVGPGTTPAPTPVPVATATARPLVPTPLPTCVPLAVPGEQKVMIGPDIQAAYPDCITINALQDTIRWTTDVKGKDLWIEFPDRPFKTMVNGAHQTNRATCSGDTCTSGQVQSQHPSDANYDGHHYWKLYKYTQVFHDSSGATADVWCDGRIIIQW